MPITILPGVIYRIQSVDYGTYLERRNDDSLVMRPDKPDSISQRWFLRPSADGSVFKVESADTDQRGFMKAASISKVSKGEVGELAFGPSDSAPDQWALIQVDKDSISPICYLLLQPAGNRDILLDLTEPDKLILSRDPAHRNKFFHGEENLQWRIVEASPSNLPETTGDPIYRIRTLNGDGIHVEKNQLSIINQSRGDHREWQIVSKGNGKCTIYNQHNKSYLNAVENSDGHWVVIFSQTANNAEWDIKKNSDFTYTISIERILRTPKHQHTQPFALTLKEKSARVILKPAKEAHNQMWLIELSDATLGPVDEPDTDADHILPNLATGEYLVKNAANSHYIRFKANTAVGTGASQFMGGSLTSKTRLKLSKVGDKGASLSCNVQGIIGNLGIKNGQVVNESMTLTIENGPIAGQYYITDGNGNAIADNNTDNLVVNQKGAGS
ncbi:hypothetical protein FRC16_003682, partial [Serendipita sp. 398]